jgi:hypothetical protein
LALSLFNRQLNKENRHPARNPHSPMNLFLTIERQPTDVAVSAVPEFTLSPSYYTHELAKEFALRQETVFMTQHCSLKAVIRAAERQPSTIAGAGSMTNAPREPITLTFLSPET